MRGNLPLPKRSVFYKTASSYEAPILETEGDVDSPFVAINQIDLSEIVLRIVSIIVY